MIANLLFLALTAFGAQGITVDSTGHVYVDPAEHAEEQRQLAILRDAMTYRPPPLLPKGERLSEENAQQVLEQSMANSAEIIERCETALREVQELTPEIHHQIVFKVAESYRSKGQAGLSRGRKNATDADRARARQDLDKAIAYYNQLVSGELGQPNPRYRADAYLALGDIQRNLKNNEKAVQYYAKAWEIAHDESIPSDTEWTAQKRKSVDTIATSRTLNALRQDIQMPGQDQVVERRIRKIDIGQFLGNIGKGEDATPTVQALQTEVHTTVRNPVPFARGSWSLWAGLVLALGTITVALVVVMRKQAQPNAAWETRTPSRQRKEEKF